METASVRSHGMGQRSGDTEGAAEAYLAGQVEILAKMLNNRSLSDVKPTFLCVCVTVFHITLTSCAPAPFSILAIMQNSTEFF